MDIETAAAPEILPYGLPRASDPDQNTLLFIDLADLSVDEEAKVISDIHTSVKDTDGNGSTVSIQVWRPPKSAFLQPLAHKHKYAIKKYFKDSKANLYGFAVLAHRAGYKFIFVADDYMKRDIRGEMDPSERFRPESYFGVMIYIELQVPQDGTQANDHIRVFARRCALGKKGNRNILNLRHSVEFVDILERDWLDIFEQLFNWGVELHDPSREVFTPNTRAMTGRDEFKIAAEEALSESTPLPTELVNQVVDWLYDNDKEIFGIPSLFREKELNIFLLFPSTDNERQNMQSAIQQRVDRYIEQLKKNHQEMCPPRGGKGGHFHGGAAGEHDEDTEDHEGDDDDDDDDDEDGEELDYPEYPDYADGSDDNEDGGESEEREESDESDEDQGSELSGQSSDSDLDDQSDKQFHNRCVRFPAKLPVRLIPWKYDRVANRIDIERYWKLIHGRFVCPVNFLLSPTGPGDPFLEPDSMPPTPLFGTVYHGGGGFKFISRNNIGRMVRYAMICHCHMHRAFELQREMKRARRLQLPLPEAELLYQPEQPLYLDSPLWKIDPSHNHHTAVILVFFMASSLSADQKTEIMKEVETPGECEADPGIFTKSCHMIPWTDGGKEAADGSLGDIWKVFCELQEEGCRLPYFFADQQSAIDRTVVIVDKDYISSKDEKAKICEFTSSVGDPHLRGLRYSRIEGREAFGIWDDINRREVAFEDIFEDESQIQTHARTDLTGAFRA